MPKPMMSVAMLLCLTLAIGCQGAQPGVERPGGVSLGGVAEPVGLTMRVQVAFQGGARRLLQVGFSDADVVDLDIVLKNMATNAVVYSTTLARPQNGLFAFNLSNLQYQTSYRLDVTARGVVGGVLQNIGTGNVSFNTSNASPVQYLEQTVTIQLDDRTYVGEAPVGVALLPGSLTQPSPAVNANPLFVPKGLVSTFVGGTQGTAEGTGTAAQFNQPSGVAFDQGGNLYVADTANHRICKVTSTGVVTTFAGSTAGAADGNGTAAQFNSPIGLAVDAIGNVYVADQYNYRIRKITPAGQVSTLAGSTQGHNDGTGTAALFNEPVGITLAPDGNLYVADYRNHRIRRVTMGGVVTTVAGSGTDGEVDATGGAAEFSFPYGIAADRLGNLFVTDSGGNRIRQVSPAGVVTTLAGSTTGGADGVGADAQFHYPTGVVVDALGRLYVADHGGALIRRVTRSGGVSTVAGNYYSVGFVNDQGAAARFSNPWSVAIAPDGRVYVADQGNHAIRRIE